MSTDIDTLSGRELDCAVASALGWKEHDIRYCKTMCLTQHRAGEWWMRPGDLRYDYPSVEFSTSLNAHLDPGGTIEWLREHGCGEVRLSWHGSVATALVQLPFSVTTLAITNRGAEQPATALSRAFLQAARALSEASNE